MRLLELFRRWGRQGRAILLPIGDITKHLCHLANDTAGDLGISRELSKTLDASVSETCREAGLAVYVGENGSPSD